MPGPTVLTLDVEGPVFEWRGPAPFYFVAVPEEESDAVKGLAAELSYGWGCVTVGARIRDTAWSTALIPKDGLYLAQSGCPHRAEPAGGQRRDDRIDLPRSVRWPDRRIATQAPLR